MEGGGWAVVGIVVVSHGNLAGALLGTAELIAGRCPYARALELRTDEAPESFRQRLLDAITVDEDGPTEWLVLTDLLGGSPHRVATMLRDDLPRPESCAVVSGVNLAMVADALLSCEGDVDARGLAVHVASTGLQQVRGSVRDELPD